MFDIDFNDNGQVVVSGRLDAAQAQRARQFFDTINGGCTVDMSGLDYISSAGLGVLLSTHKRLMAGQSGLALVNVNPHIREILGYSGFDRLFVICPA
jgi:anti-anti-sigma factor